MVFDSVGRDILDNAFQGYNACIFAYGQTGDFRRSKNVTFMPSRPFVSIAYHDVKHLY